MMGFQSRAETGTGFFYSIFSVNRYQMSGIRDQITPAALPPEKSNKKPIGFHLIPDT
jgi:hypothetical protein